MDVLEKPERHTCGSSRLVKACMVFIFVTGTQLTKAVRIYVIIDKVYTSQAFHKTSEVGVIGICLSETVKVELLPNN